MEIKFEELTYLSADGHTRVHGYIWSPTEGVLRGIVQIAHGMCEYVQRYDALARRFCEQGFVFCGNDHLGHGNTAFDDDDLGFTAPRGGAEYLVEDLHTMSALVRDRFADLPLVLYGHSMGSFVARVYLTRYGDELAAALISGTAGPEQPTGLALRLTHAIARVRGDRYRSKLLTSLAFGSYNHRFKEEKSAVSWLTRDKEVRERYAKDRFCRVIFTTGAYDTLFTLLSTVSKRNWAADVPKKLPIFIFSGEEDPVGNYGKGVRKVYERLSEAGVEYLRLKLYPDGRHEMHWEENRDEVLADVLSFLKEVGI